MTTTIAPHTQWSPNQLTSLQTMGIGADLSPSGDRPVFDPNLHELLRTDLESKLSPILKRAGATTTQPLVINKYLLSEVFRCETAFCAASDDQFEWNIPKARGTVLHKVLQGSVASRTKSIPSPVLVEQAIDRLQRDPDSSLAEWLRGLTEFEHAELQVEVTELFIKVRTDLPPLQPGWQPRAESRARAELCEGTCILTSKFDLALGSPKDGQARTFVVDFKTGGIRHQHQTEMRFYALLEALRTKAPPWRMATYYIDSGTWIPMDVDAEILQVALRSTVDGVTKIAELSAGLRAPESCKQPCSTCNPV